MKRIGLACITVALLSTTAHAQMAVLDVANLANTAKSVANEAVAAGKRVEVINNQILQLVRLKQTYEAVSHGNLAAMANAVPELGALGLSNPLGDNTAALVASIAGSGQALNGLVASASATGTLAQGLLKADQFYAPQGGDFRAVAMLQAANALAAQKAIAETALASNGQRLDALATLRRNLDGATDIKASTDATARMAGESATAIAQSNQLLALQILQHVQTETDAARELQAWRCSAERLIVQANAAATAAAGGAVTLVSADASVAGMPSCQVLAAPVQPNAPQFQNVSYETMAPSSGGGGSALDTMLGQTWGQAAADNAAALGVNGDALAATCLLESNCRANPGGTGTISGAFQISDGTYAQMVREVQASNPDLAAQITAKNDPASQSIAAAQYLKDGALALQGSGIANPTVLDVRGYYNFGPGSSAALAGADNGQLMSAVLPGLSAATLRANGISDNTTVGAWRAGVTSKIGADTASQSVLNGLKST